MSADGSRVYLRSAGSYTSEDADPPCDLEETGAPCGDVYENSACQHPPCVDWPAVDALHCGSRFVGGSDSGDRVFGDTAGSVPGDMDSDLDIYERFSQHRDHGAGFSGGPVSALFKKRLPTVRASCTRLPAHRAAQPQTLLVDVYKAVASTAGHRAHRRDAVTDRPRPRARNAPPLTVSTAHRWRSAPARRPPGSPNLTVSVGDGGAVALGWPRAARGRAGCARGSRRRRRCPDPLQPLERDEGLGPVQYTGELRASAQVRLTDRYGGIAQTTQDFRSLSASRACRRAHDRQVAVRRHTTLDTVIRRGAEGTRAIWAMDG